MSLTTYTTFERIDPRPGDKSQRVPSLCNGIHFIALPAESIGGGAINLTAAQVAALAPRVNGLPLLPVGSQLPSTADRLELLNPPGVLDKTVYEVEMDAEAMQTAGVRFALMVIRRHTSA